jgi:hypothetical protein
MEGDEDKLEGWIGRMGKCIQTHHYYRLNFQIIIKTHQKTFGGWATPGADGDLKRSHRPPKHSGPRSAWTQHLVIMRS